MSEEIDFGGTRNRLRRLLWSFLLGLSGQADAGEFAPHIRGIKLRIGMVALSCVQEAFIAKASGGSDEAGIQWEALKPQTIANRPIGQGDAANLKARGITKRKYGYGARRQSGADLDALGRLKRGFLTDAQDKRWRRIFAQKKSELRTRHGMSDEAASARAAQTAWAVLKAEGAKTRLDVLGSRNVQIGRDSGRLFNSLSPGVDDPEQHPILVPPPDVEDRILREEVSSVVVGTNVEYAGAFHSKRPLWPTSGNLPSAWMERINEAARSGVTEAIEMILRGAA